MVGRVDGIWNMGIVLCFLLLWQTLRTKATWGEKGVYFTFPVSSTWLKTVGPTLGWESWGSYGGGTLLTGLLRSLCWTSFLLQARRPSLGWRVPVGPSTPNMALTGLVFPSSHFLDKTSRLHSKSKPPRSTPLFGYFLPLRMTTEMPRQRSWQPALITQSRTRP